MNKINKNKFVLLAFVSVFLLSATIRNSFMTEAPFEKTASSDPIDPFPQAGKFYTLAGRSFVWEVIDGQNVTTSHYEEINKWSVQDIVGDVAFINRTYVEIFIYPKTGGNYTATYDFDYTIATNRTILSAYWNEMDFTTSGFQWLGGQSIDEDVGEHTWAWFPSDLYIGARVNVSWTFDRNFDDDMSYEVVGEEIIKVLGEKQDCWLLWMSPSLRIDGTEWRTETYWVDKDTHIPLKIYCKGWAVDESFGWDDEFALAHTNINLGPESTKPTAPTYTLAFPKTPSFPETGKFCTWYLLDGGWYISGESNVTYYYEGLFTIWVVNVTDDEAFVYRILWFEEGINVAEGVEELEAAYIQYYNYTINIKTREILDVAGTFYSINMTSMTHSEEDRTSQLAGDIGEETWYWLPKNLYLGAVISIGWTRDMPWNVDNGTYTVTGEKLVNAFDKPQACWILYMPPTPSIDGTWNYSETFYSDKDTGIPLCDLCDGWTVDGNSADKSILQIMDTNVDLGPNTYVFQAVADSQTFNITVVTNSTIPTQSFNFSQGEKKISFNVTGLSGTAGFCNITIPRTLMDCTNLDEWVIFANGTDISSICIKNRDADYTYICTPYNHSVQPIVVKGTWVIPEFPTAIIMPLFMIATLMTIIVYKKKTRIGAAKKANRT